MVNDNVQHAGEEVPVDLVLSDIAESAGFGPSTFGRWAEAKATVVSRWASMAAIDRSAPTFGDGRRRSEGSRLRIEEFHKKLLASDDFAMCSLRATFFVRHLRTLRLFEAIQEVNRLAEVSKDLWTNHKSLGIEDDAWKRIKDSGINPLLFSATREFFRNSRGCYSTTARSRLFPRKA
ncbi:MAG: hypothetical protein MZV70_51760 [Desulfobacterales bacterium]|nr:hypothetical protein [Desulfobacterales bacterium]